MADHFVINVLSEDECREYARVLDSLSSEWTKRPQGSSHLYTLGSATHADIETCDLVSDIEFNKIEYNNEILRNHFPDLYIKLIRALESKLGPCELITDKAPLPGFFIYGEPKPNDIRKEELPPVAGMVRIHFDGQVYALDYIWNDYSDVEEECISFTLAIEMPEHGAAFLLWDQPDLGCYLNGEIADIYKSYDYYEADGNREFLDSYALNKVPEVIEHVVGRMIVNKGKQWHAAAGSTKQFSTDRRIAFQGFGVKCDGVWRLFF